MGALSGPRRAPKAPGPARHLVVLLHAYDSSGEEFLRLAPLLQRFAPHAAFVLPNGPFPCETPKGGHQWWPPSGDDSDRRVEGVRAIRPRLDAFLDEELARLGLADERLVLAGFSQGAMAALHVGLRRRVAGVISFSGDLLDVAGLADSAARPPVLLLHGSEDAVLPPAVLHRTAEALRSQGFAPEAHLDPGLAHGVGLDGVRRAGAFLRRAFG